MVLVELTVTGRREGPKESSGVLGCYFLSRAVVTCGPSSFGCKVDISVYVGYILIIYLKKNNRTGLCVHSHKQNQHISN